MAQYLAISFSPCKLWLVVEANKEQVDVDTDLAFVTPRHKYANQKDMLSLQSLKDRSHDFVNLFKSKSLLSSFEGAKMTWEKKKKKLIILIRLFLYLSMPTTSPLKAIFSFYIFSFYKRNVF